MRVLLGNPPWSRPGLYGVRAGSRWPHFENEWHEYMPFPFLLAYAAAVLEREHFEVECVDALAGRMSRSKFLKAVEANDPDILLLEVSSISMEDDLEVVRECRRNGFDKRLVLCGLHEPMYRSSFLAEHSEVDAVLVGEYDTAVLDLCRACSSSADPAEAIGGVILRRHDGEKSWTEAGRTPTEVNELPWPARHRFDMSLYRDEPG